MMPFLNKDPTKKQQPENTGRRTSSSSASKPRQAQQSHLSKSLFMRRFPAPTSNPHQNRTEPHSDSIGHNVRLPTNGFAHLSLDGHDTHLPQPELKPLPYVNGHGVHNKLAKDGVGNALSDTPMPSAPSSPRIPVARMRATTLDIPGLTKSKVSPDGRIAQRDVGAKLLIVMVGLPARGKSYITKKMARYLNWLQHDTKIFNVGERRREAAGGHSHQKSFSKLFEEAPGTKTNGATQRNGFTSPRSVPNQILLNGIAAPEPQQPLKLPASFHGETIGNHNEQDHVDEEHAQLAARFPELTRASTPEEHEDPDKMDQSASFFDPSNRKAALIRERAALETLDECLDYILGPNGTVGILDATNSTLERRKLIMKHVRERAGPDLNVLFVESVCKDENLLESNMRLKLSGPDYKDKDPVKSLEDFKKRVAIYAKNYIPLGDYEEDNNMPYIKMIDVGRKMMTHMIKGFLSAQVVYYLVNFNLAPRMIWITRHGESEDNVNGKIGGNADLTANGHRYGAAMSKFIKYQRQDWEIRQRDKEANMQKPPHEGDTTPPNPHYNPEGFEHAKSFCVWSSMLQRSYHTAAYFDDEEYDVKQMRMLDELNAGIYEGMTYEKIKNDHTEEFNRRRADKLQYRYPGPGGEGYLDVINRLRPVIVELERMTDHCLLITHRSVARVLLAYFQGLNRDDVADLDCPLGMLYMMEPKPYGVEFKAYCYNPEADWFDYLPDFKLKRARGNSSK